MKSGSIILYKYLLSSFLCFTIFFWSYSSKAQNNRDDKPVNLKVLPSTINEKELHQLMDSYSTALGVNCNYCHGDPKDNSFKRTDFGADTNPKKNVAREMIKLVNGINTNMLQGARALDAGIGSISCVSCHHGSASIDQLEDVLFRSYKKKGIDSAFIKYNNLKKQYYGSFTYDFSNRTLLSFASKVNEAGNFDDAIIIGKKNCELFPDYTWSFVFIADIYSKNGKKDEAVKNYEKAIQLDPNNRYASQQLRKLQSSNN